MSLETFVLVNKDKVISPLLVTTRSYGDWLEETFDSNICQMEIYLSSLKQDGSRVMERHPGTKIGQFFKNITVNDNSLVSWYLPNDKQVAKRLIKNKMVDTNDIRNGLRVYTTEQIEFYINSNIDRNFKLASYIATPKQIRISDGELQEVKMPQVKQRNKKLF